MIVHFDVVKMFIFVLDLVLDH